MPAIRDSLPFTPVDIRDAGADYLAARLGIRNSSYAHPAAEQLADTSVSLAEMALVFGRCEALRRRVNMTPYQAMTAGLGTADFADVLTGSIRQLVAATYEQETDYRKISKLVAAPNFHPVQFPTFDLNTDLPQILENSEFRHRATIKTNSGETASVESYGALIAITRQTIINDDVGLVQAVFQQFAAAASRLESEAVFGVLENNSTLKDGSAMFSGTNLLSTDSFGQAKLGSAFAALRRQTSAAGVTVNNRPAVLVVSPELEVDALALVATLSNAGRALQIVSSPNIPAKHWYLLADPARSPVVGLLHLDGDPSGVRVERAPRKPSSDSITLKLGVDYGVTALSRMGAVRCEDVS